MICQHTEILLLLHLVVSTVQRNTVTDMLTVHWLKTQETVKQSGTNAGIEDGSP